ncbi:CD109 antigen [Xenopus tropicalis]|uniref:CD109 antigen n=1 Tax=Xenopus tropicalis TaxID=8364 RepID=A0A8J1JLK2_XENTR|nr:CD109 antigen [Xenopus tropicalis]
MYLLDHLLLRCICLSLLIFHFSDARASYYISAPNIVSSGINTTLSVHWFGSSYSEINVTAGILHQDVTVVQATQVFQKDSIGIMSIPATPLDSSNYFLFVNGSAGNELIFSNNFGLTIKQIQTKTFIETDKKNYRPQETVKIRIITVYTDLTPYKGPINIYIRDSSYDIIKQILNQNTELGVFSTEVLLPAKSALGSLSISAGPNGYESYESIVVVQNEPPDFDVTIVAPSYYYKQSKQDFVGKVFANYSNGRPVKGTVTLSLNFDTYNIYYYDSYPEDLTDVNKIFEIYGSVNFSFSYSEAFKCPFWQRLILTASVTEEKTGKTVTASWYIQRATSQYRIFVVGQLDYSFPNQAITAKIQIQRSDDLPLTQEEMNTNVLITFGNYLPITRTYSISASGILNIQIPFYDYSFHSSHSYVLYMTATYKDSTHQWTVFTPDTWYWNPAVNIKGPDTPVQTGIPFTISVGTVPEVQYVYYVVSGGGVIVAAGKTSNSSFTLTAETSWLPSVQVTAYFINPDERFGSDIGFNTKIFHITGNKVALSWSKSKAKPSEYVSLTISNITKTPAIVGLKVADINDKLSGNTNSLAAKVENIYSGNSYSPYSDGNIGDPYSYGLQLHSNDPNNDPINQPVNLRPLIPETWIWLETHISSGVNSSLQVTLPHKVMTWVASAFVISEGLGLGVSEQYPELEVFQPLLLTLNAPRTVIRGENFILKVTLEAYIATDFQVTVMLEPSSSFEIIIPDNNTNSVPGQRSVFIQSNGSKEVLFPINPKKLGEMSLTVQANALGFSDSATQTVLVKAEGIQHFYSSSVILNGTDGKKLSFTFPVDVVVDTKQASLSITGNFLAPSIKGLESLIQLPTGCGEQNMIHFAPVIYILQYLIASKQITEDFRTKAIRFMEKGYQTELNYQTYYGSFSAFGSTDFPASTWLSAFVLRCLLQARQFISISEDVLSRTKKWLFFNLNEETGIFQESEQILKTRLQVGSNGVIAHNAYILIALLEDESNKNVAYRMNKTIQYLENKTEEGITSNYTLSIVAYALSVANSSKAAAALTQLNSRANSTGLQRYWSSGIDPSNDWQPLSADIETAAYALLSHCQQNRIAEGVPIMNWLSQHRNHLGGYSSTQDTIMALQALTKFMTLVPTSNNTSLTVSVTDSGSIVPNTFNITNENLLVVQSQQIYALEPLELVVSAAGEGAALLQLNVVYNSKGEAVPSEVFKLSATVDDSDSHNRISVNVCSSYQGPEKEPGMILWEVDMLSGFKLDPVGINLNDPLKLVETKDEKVFLYFDSMNAIENCVAVPMVRTSMVVGSQPALITILDYYNPEIRTTRIYNSDKLSKATVCEFCGLNCNNCISNVTTSTNTTEQVSNSSATAPKLAMLWFCMICMWYIL